MISITLIPPANTDRLFCRPTPATMALGLGALQTPASTLDPSIEQPSTPPIWSSLACDCRAGSCSQAPCRLRRLASAPSAPAKSP